MLAFDSSAMELLLSEKNSKYFSAEFPVIYRNKMEKKDGINYYYSNAIDTAVKNNQVKAAKLIIKYIIQFQNNFSSSFLFTHNLPILL